MKFDQRPCTIMQGLWPDFETTLKICKKITILVEINSNFLHNIRTCICISKYASKKNGEFCTKNAGFFGEIPDFETFLV